MSKPIPTLTDMPWNVKQDIVNYLDYVTRLSFRKCTRELRNIIDNSEVKYPVLCVALLEHGIRISFYSKSLEHQQNLSNMIEYSEVSDDSCKVTYKKRGEDFHMIVTGQNCIQRAISDFATFVKSPRSYLLSLVFNHEKSNSAAHKQRLEMMFTCFKNTLETLPQKPNVHQLYFHFPASQDDVLHVLPYLKSQVLKHIIIMNRTRTLENLEDTEQWKAAEKITLTCTSNVQIRNLLHLLSFDLKNYQLVPEEMPLLIQKILTRRDTSFHYRIGLRKNYDKGPIRKWLADNKELATGHYMNSWYAKIPGTDNHYNILFEDSELQIYSFLSRNLQNK